MPLSKLSRRSINLNNILEKLNMLIKLVKQDSKLVNQLSMENKIIVFKALDTGRSITIELKNGDISGCANEPIKYDMKFVASENIHLGILSGEIDPEGAFFSRKIKVQGSLIDIVRFKNEYLSRIQSCFRRVFNET